MYFLITCKTLKDPLEASTDIFEIMNVIGMIRARSTLAYTIIVNLSILLLLG